jgi:hypothetical protein
MSMSYGTQNELLMTNLLRFYNVFTPEGEFNPDNNLDKMLTVITGSSKISLRIVDWFTTNYAKKYFVIYPISEEIPRFKVYDDYKLKLKAYSKKRFDPFCRWKRINVPYINGTHVETTIGQLNFFKWALENNVLNYVTENYVSIESDMNIRNSTSRRNLTAPAAGSDNKTRKRREELSISASKSIKMENIKIVVAFT